MYFSPALEKGQVTNMTTVWYEIKRILIQPACQIALLLLIVMSSYICYQEIYGDDGIEWLTKTGERLKGPAAAQEMRTAQEEWSGTLDRQMMEKALELLKQYEAEEKDHPEDINYRFQRIQPLMAIRDILNLSGKDYYDW